MTEIYKINIQNISIIFQRNTRSHVNEYSNSIMLVENSQLLSGKISRSHTLYFYTSSIRLKNRAFEYRTSSMHQPTFKFIDF